MAAILDRNVGGVWYIVSTISAHSLTGLRVEIVQSLSSPFFPPLIGAEPGGGGGGAKGESRSQSREVQDNLHAHAQNEPIKHY